MLNAAIQSEYRQEATYRGVLAILGNDVKPFAPVAEAELQHVGAVSTLFTNRGLAVPAFDGSTVSTFSTLSAACSAAMVAENASYRMYDDYLEGLEAAGVLPSDVNNVFTNLATASRDNHLPAFEKCAK
jgi:hypothetical protein